LMRRHGVKWAKGVKVLERVLLQLMI
jgi:hypothetical protein